MISAVNIPRRFLAIFFDTIFCLILNMYAFGYLYLALTYTESTFLSVLEYALYYALIPVYFLPEFFWGNTLGKLLFAQRVVSRNGARPALFQRLTRWTLKSSPWLFTAAYTIIRILGGHFHDDTPPFIVFLYKIPDYLISQPLHDMMDYSDYSVFLGPLLTLDWGLDVGLILLFPLLLSELLIFLPGRRTFIDRLSATTVAHRRDIHTVPAHGFEVQ